MLPPRPKALECGASVPLWVDAQGQGSATKRRSIAALFRFAGRGQVPMRRCIAALQGAFGARHETAFSVAGYGACLQGIQYRGKIFGTSLRPGASIA